MPDAADDERFGDVPAAERARLRRLQAAGQWSSALSAGEHAALVGVGFHPAGQVLGASVWSLNQTGRGVCGASYSSRQLLGTARGRRFGRSYAEPAVPGEPAHVGRRRTTHMQVMRPLVETYTRARRSALKRLQREAAALGADGVVGVHLAVEPFAASVQRSLGFIAYGTAVRSSGSTHLAGPFLSDLDGTDLALLLRSGWAPTGLVMGVGAVVAHDDLGTAQLRGRGYWYGNQELQLYSDLATQARVDARARLNEDVRLHGGEAAVLGSMNVSVHAQSCGSGAQGSTEDHLVEAVLLGTAITRFSVPEARPETTALPMLRLSGRTRNVAARSTVVDPFTHRRGN